MSIAPRPRFHLQPERNWMNDPNGPIFINGRLHMFYQHNPHEPVWGNMTWGHAVSDDMVRWRRLPHALHPDRPYDRGGVFSGCCVIHQGLPHILYTGVQPETLCMAVGDAEGMHYRKHPDNPILTRGDRSLIGWRDPYIWREGGEYRMLIGSGDADGGFAEMYKGTDLLRWEGPEPFARAQDFGLADVIWECPVFLREGDRGAMLISAVPASVVRTFTGRYEQGRLSECTPGLLDAGDCVYAPNLVRHPDGRWILYGWMRECGAEAARAAQGWQGMLTIPREMRFEEDALCQYPAKEIDLLRVERIDHPEEPGQHFELCARLDLRQGEVEIAFLLDESGRGVAVTLDAQGLALCKGGLCEKEETLRAAYASPEGFCDLRLFVDGTAIELFYGKGKALSTRVYPGERHSGLRILERGGASVCSRALYRLEGGILSE